MLQFEKPIYKITDSILLPYICLSLGNSLKKISWYSCNLLTPFRYNKTQNDIALDIL